MGKWAKSLQKDARFYATELERLNLLKVGNQKIYVDPKEVKEKIENNHEALAAIIILAKNNGRETFKERLKSVKEAYVQKQIEEEDQKNKIEQENRNQ